MSRRDTIIIAVLVNAALLMVLFVTAIRSGKEEGGVPTVNFPKQLAEKAAAVPSSQEDLLNEYIMPLPAGAESSLAKGADTSLPILEEIPLVLPLSDPTPVDEEIAIAPMPAPSTSAQEEIPAAPSYVNVTVKKGDFLEKIAKANGSSVSAIMKANNLASTQLKVGQVLKVPLSGAKSAEKPVVKQAPSSSQAPVSSDSDFYVVKEGDNPWLIASRNHLKLEELLRLNQLDEQKAKKLRPGDKLRIR